MSNARSQKLHLQKRGQKIVWAIGKSYCFKEEIADNQEKHKGK